MFGNNNEKIIICFYVFNNNWFYDYFYLFKYKYCIVMGYEISIRYLQDIKVRLV